MAYEIVGSRVLGPYLGTSIFIWTSLIGIVLASLSLGYWLGGRLADREPSYPRLAWIILLSGIFILLSNLFKDLFLRHLPSLLPGLRWQSIVSSLILFAPAAVMLGMVSPYAVRLKIKALETSGRTVGNLYALSTIGSIVGTFLAGFFLLPLTGTTALIYGLAIVQALLSVFLFLYANKLKSGVLSLFLLLLSSYSLLAANVRVSAYIDTDTHYNRVWIYNAIDPVSGKEARFMRINNESSSAMFPGSDSLVFPYARNYSLAEQLTPGFRSTLMLGGAAYSFPKYFLRAYPTASMDVVEIDPELTHLAREHFHLKDDPRLGIFHEDARTYINSCQEKYDVVYGDLFRSQYTLPWHLTTLEAAVEYYRVLNDGGCMMVNIISPIQGPGSRFLSAELATFSKVFDHVRIYGIDDPDERETIQSIMLVAMKSKGEFPAVDLSGYTVSDVTGLVPGGIPILTDDFAPVDYFMAAAIH
jgi:predicted membrane-bound spermidine synthase